MTTTCLTLLIPFVEVFGEVELLHAPNNPIDAITARAVVERHA
jgi:hypothetical protein